MVYSSYGVLNIAINYTKSIKELQGKVARNALKT